MESQIYHALAKAGSQYWWNQGRQHLLTRLWARYGRPAAAGARLQILDIGCAAGGTLSYLSEWGEAWGLDLSAEALALCRNWGIPEQRLVLGNAEDLSAFRDEQFDLITAVEVLEHLEHPERSLREIRRILKPDGLLILTVPADPKLWSDRDDRLGHYRRYRLAELVQAAGKGGFDVRKASYANAFYYWPYRLILAWRRLCSGGTARIKTDTLDTPRWISDVFRFCLKIETAIILRAGLPWGVSAVCAARKKNA